MKLRLTMQILVGASNSHPPPRPSEIVSVWSLFQILMQSRDKNLKINCVLA